MEATKSEDPKFTKSQYLAFPKKDFDEMNKLKVQLKTVNAHIVRGNILLGRFDPSKDQYHEVTRGLAKLYHIRALLLMSFDTVATRIEEYYLS